MILPCLASAIRQDGCYGHTQKGAKKGITWQNGLEENETREKGPLGRRPLQKYGSSQFPVAQPIFLKEVPKVHSKAQHNRPNKVELARISTSPGAQVGEADRGPRHGS